MRRQYLHLCVYPCDKCAGPVVAGSLAIRENEISKETEMRTVGAVCLSCGHKQDLATNPARIRHLLPVEWEPVVLTSNVKTTIAFVEARDPVMFH